METYNTVAIETDINGVDNNEELTSLFARALEICQPDKPPSNAQYLSSPNQLTDCKDTQSIREQSFLLQDIDFNECLKNVQTSAFIQIKQENEDEIIITTHNSIAIETDINGIDSNELTAIFTRAVDLCLSTETSEEMDSYTTSSIQYISSENVAYCIHNADSVDLEPVALPDIDFHECLHSVRAAFMQSKKENEAESSNAMQCFHTKVAENVDDSSANRLGKYLSTSHLQKHAKGCSKGNKCSACKKVGNLSRKAFNKHIKAHELKCTECGKMFKSQKPYEKHLKNHNKDGTEPEEKIECTQCGKLFKSQKPYEKHLKNHNKDGTEPEEKIECTQCGKLYKSQKPYEKHLKNHKDGTEPEEKIECTQCGKLYKSQKPYEKHLKNHKDGHVFKKRPSKVRQDSGQQQNGANSQQPRTKRNNKYKEHICSYCNQDCHFFSLLQNHIRALHTLERPFQCHHCVKAFASANSLREHLRRQIGDKSHKCTLCDKSFVYKTELEEHFRIHTGEKPFKCEHCDKSFKTKKIHKRHLLQEHTGKRPYKYDSSELLHKCEFCFKCFAVKANLEEHFKGHSATEKRPQKCEFCDMAFKGEKSWYIRHVRLSHGKHIQHHCTFCDNVYVEKVNLEEHLGIHN